MQRRAPAKLDAEEAQRELRLGVGFQRVPPHVTPITAHPAFGRKNAPQLGRQSSLLSGVSGVPMGHPRSHRKPPAGWCTRRRGLRTRAGALTQHYPRRLADIVNRIFCQRLDASSEAVCQRASQRAPRQRSSGARTDRAVAHRGQRDRGRLSPHYSRASSGVRRR